MSSGMRAKEQETSPAVENRLRLGGWILGTVSVMCGVIAITVDASGSWAGISSDSWIAVVSGAGLGILGAVVVDHQPRNRATWLLLVGGFLLALQGLVTAFAGLADPSAAGAGATTWLRWGTVLDSLDFSCGTLFLFLFPHGHTPSGWWRWPWRAYAVTTIAVIMPVTVIAAWALPGPALAAHIPEPLGIVAPHPAPPALMALQAAEIAIQLWWLVAAAFLIALLRSSRGSTRRQLTWAVTGLVTTTGVLVIGYWLVGWPAEVVAPIPFYIGVLIAMQWHQLWDINRLLRRATLYAALTIVLAVVYAAVVLALTFTISPLTAGSPIVVMTATLAIAAAFAPLRRSLQSLIDRRFDQRTWRAVQAVETFTERLREGTARPAEIEAALRSAIAEPTLTVRYIEPGGGLIDIAGTPSQRTPGTDRERRTVAIGGHDVAVVELPALVVAEHPRLVTAVLTAAALPLENAALHARAAMQLADVRASRARLVEAADSERRRIERDVHDGAQQRLVALALRLRMAQRRLHEREPVEAALLGDAVAELRTAVDELRDLTRGMLPPVLAEEGLGIALATLAARMPVPLTLDVPRRRFPDDVEAAVWFVSCEGLANAVKHADAGTLKVVVRYDDTSVHVEVTDDGKGGATPSPGGGLQGLADRVAAIGGRLTIDTRAGRGTTIIADLPCAS